MNKNFIAILITVIMSFTMVCTAGAQGLPNKPDITDFSYTLKDNTGAMDTAISSGGSLEVNITLDNNTASIQPYTVLLQILNKGTKVSLKAVSGTISASDDEIICLSDGFPESETDFSNYSAEVYVWSDMNSMQPISTYSVLGSDNNDIYAYKIDNAELVYAHNNTNHSYSFGKGYAGRLPVITPIFRDIASRFVLSDVVQPVTSDGQQTLGFEVSSQMGTTKNYSLTMYGEDNSNNTKNADLTGITLPIGAYNGNYKEIPSLYPAFNKDVTEYDVYTYTSTSTSYSPVAGLEVGFETVNSDAAVALTTSPDATLDETTAVYTVTSADGNVTKNYTINYHALAKDTNVLAITKILNGYASATGANCYYSWYGKGGTDTPWNNVNMVIQDGKFGKYTIKATRPIIEIDISQGPAEISHGILTLSNIKNIKDANTKGTLHLYKIDNSIYTDGVVESLTNTDTEGYFGDEICSVNISGMTASKGDMYYINIDASYYNSLKAAGRTKMYIGFAGQADSSANILGTLFGSNGTGEGNSRFHYIAD